ncbi:MAG: sulfotransferase, partial [Chloroflexi bacterium]|nr:sulfotransferase [Chloroflexota bacterium]
YDLVKSTPKPKRWIEVRFEDFVQNQAETLERLEAFLGIPLARVILRKDTINRWRRDEGVNYFDFFEPAMREYNYEIPPPNDHCRGEAATRPRNRDQQCHYA